MRACRRREGRVKPILLHTWLTCRRVSDEMNYAQRRMLELRTGQVLTPETQRRIAREQIAQLNKLLLDESAAMLSTGQRKRPARSGS
jgi:hypothetical protein